MSNGHACQPFRGWGKKRIWHLCKCHPSTAENWLARVHDVVVFKTKVLHNTQIRTQMDWESSKECSVSFLWTNESFSLWNCLSKNSTSFSTRRIGALSLFWTKQGREVSEDTWGTLHTLWSKKSTFLKRNFCIYKGFKDVFYILTWAWKKNHRMCIWNCFFAMGSTDLTCLNTTINLSYANCFLWVFE